MKILSKYHSFYILLVALDLPAIYLGITGSLDPYHDGAIVPANIGVADGLAIYSGVNHQYGFIPVYINATIIKFFGNYFILYRITGLSFLILNALLVYLIIKRHVDKGTALLLSFSSFLITPAWAFFDDNKIHGLGSWPNIFGIFFTLLSIYFFQRSLEVSSGTRWMVASGLFSALSFGCRIQFLALIFAQSLIFFWIYLTKSLERHQVIAWFSGVIVGLLSQVFFLTLIGSLNDSLKQLFLVWFSGAPNPGRIGIGNLVGVFISFSIFIILLFGIHISQKMKFKRIPQLITVIILIQLLYIGHTRFSNLISIPVRAKVLLADSLSRTLFTIATFLVILVLFFGINGALKLRNHWRVRAKLETSDLIYVYVFASCIGMLAQFHNLNSDYLFMVIHPFLIWFALLMHRKGNRIISNYLGQLVLTTLVGFLVFSVALSLTKLDFVRSSYSTSFLWGMNEYDNSKLNQIDYNFRIIKNLKAKGHIRYDCPYGIYSVNDEGYLLDNKWTWNEIPLRWRIENISTAIPGNLIVTCSEDALWGSIYRNLESDGYIKFMAHKGDFRIYRIISPPKFDS
jgi:hypothetical protein